MWSPFDLLKGFLRVGKKTCAPCDFEQLRDLNTYIKSVVCFCQQFKRLKYGLEALANLLAIAAIQRDICMYINADVFK